MAGTENGIDEPILTMALHLDPSRILNAESTLSRKAGQYYPQPPNQHVPNKRWLPLNQYLVRPDAQLVALLDPPFNNSTPQSRLYPRLCPGNTRKWRTIYPCSRLGSNGFCRIGRTSDGMANFQYD